MPDGKCSKILKQNLQNATILLITTDKFDFSKGERKITLFVEVIRRGGNCPVDGPRSYIWPGQQSPHKSTHTGCVGGGG